MKRRVLTSIAASVAITSVIALTGCGSSSSPAQDPGAGTQNPGAGTQNPVNNPGWITIQTRDGNETVNPVTGGTVVISQNNNGTKCFDKISNVATVVPSELNKCAGASSDSDGDGIVCGPKDNITYVFQSNFGKLGSQDNDPNTADGGALLYDAETYYNGVLHPTPLEGNTAENRIDTVYIPTNYIKVTDDFKTKTLDEQYDAMKNYLANVCNMQCIATEDNSKCNNPYFDENKTKGSFVATYVMWFSPNGESTRRLEEEFNAGNYKHLEYLTVQFQLDVEPDDGNSSKLIFTSPAGTPVVFGGKMAGQGALTVTTSNDVINSVLHERHPYVDSAFTINMAKYFDKLIGKGDSIGVSDYAKKILVKNAQHPWPVRIYGTLHEIKNNGYDRSFVRNPGKLNATTFNLDEANIPYSSAYGAGGEDKTAVKAMKFYIVYPGGEYNEL